MEGNESEPGADFQDPILGSHHVGDEFNFGPFIEPVDESLDMKIIHQPMPRDEILACSDGNHGGHRSRPNNVFDVAYLRHATLSAASIASCRARNSTILSVLSTAAF